MERQIRLEMAATLETPALRTWLDACARQLQPALVSHQEQTQLWGASVVGRSVEPHEWEIAWDVARPGSEDTVRVDVAYDGPLSLTTRGAGFHVQYGHGDEAAIPDTPYDAWCAGVEALLAACRAPQEGGE